MIVVGIAGHFGAGKDTVAQRLVLRHGFVRVGFADCLKHEVAAKLRGTLLAYAGERGTVIHNPDAAIHTLLWDERTPMTRKLLQEWGTELRRTEDPEYWVAAWRNAASKYPRVVVPDVRFINEALAITERGGRLVRVERPGYHGDGHASETSLSSWTGWARIFINDGTVDALHDAVDQWWFGTAH